MVFSIEPVGIVKASKNRDLIIDAATIANPRALVQSAAIVFLLGLSFEPISLKIKYSPWPTNGAIKNRVIWSCQVLSSLSFTLDQSVGSTTTFLESNAK